MVTEADAEAWARQLAMDHHVDLEEISWVAGEGGWVRLTDAGPRLTLARSILVDRPTMRFHVAHEVGHLALGHASDGRARVRAAVPYLVLGVLLELVAMVVASWWRWCIVAIPLVFLALLAVMGRRLVLPRERQADQFAATVGAPAWAAQPPPERRQWGSRLIKTHPTWSERISGPSGPVTGS